MSLLYAHVLPRGEKRYVSDGDKVEVVALKNTFCVCDRFIHVAPSVAKMLIYKCVRVSSHKNIFICWYSENESNCVCINVMLYRQGER